MNLPVNVPYDLIVHKKRLRLRSLFVIDYEKI